MSLPGTATLSAQQSFHYTSAMDFGGESKDQLRKRLKEAGIHLNVLGEALLASELFFTTQRRQTATVVLVTVAELGLPEGGDLTQIRARVREMGYHECPVDLAVHYRLQYLDQPEEVEPGKNKAPRGSITVLSAPLSEDEDFPKGFYLRRIEGQLWLRGYTCGLDVPWAPDAVLAVCDRLD